MDKEKATRDINVRIQPSLYKVFSDKCQSEYKSISEVIRMLIVEYIKD